MEFMQSETRKNLARSFAGESQARTRYTVYAQVARKENCEWIARVFEETAANEAVHAEEFLEMLRDKIIHGTYKSQINMLSELERNGMIIQESTMGESDTIPDVLGKEKVKFKDMFERYCTLMEDETLI